MKHLVDAFYLERLQMEKIKIRNAAGGFDHVTRCERDTLEMEKEKNKQFQTRDLRCNQPNYESHVLHVKLILTIQNRFPFHPGNGPTNHRHLSNMWGEGLRP